MSKEQVIQPTYYVRHPDDSYSVADPQPVHEQPSLVLALPDYETRRIVIASDEVIDGERLVCVAIKGGV